MNIDIDETKTNLNLNSNLNSNTNNTSNNHLNKSISFIEIKNSQYPYPQYAQHYQINKLKTEDNDTNLLIQLDPVPEKNEKYKKSIYMLNYVAKL